MLFWQIRSLFDGVVRFSNSHPISLGVWEGLDGDTLRQFVNRIPWKQVAEWMEDQGSYRFGNATVKKKYLEQMRKRGAPL